METHIIMRFHNNSLVNLKNVQQSFDHNGHLFCSQDQEKNLKIHEILLGP